MKAIFTGNLSGGLALHCVVADDAAGPLLDTLTKPGLLADALPVCNPSEKDRTAKNYATGSYYVVFGTGLRGGFEVFGPFPEEDLAEDFAEEHRPEDSEWEIFEPELS